MTRPIDCLEPLIRCRYCDRLSASSPCSDCNQTPTRDKLDEACPPGWYELDVANVPGTRLNLSRQLTEAQGVIRDLNKHRNQLREQLSCYRSLADDNGCSKEESQFEWLKNRVEQLAEAQAEIERLREEILAKDNLLLDLMQTKEECTAEIYNLKVTFDAYRDRFGCLACGEHHPADSMCPPHECRQSESFGSLKTKLHLAKKQLDDYAKLVAVEKHDQSILMTELDKKLRDAEKRADAAEARVKELEANLKMPCDDSLDGNYWLLFFDDAERHSEVFTSELAARQRFKECSPAWHCKLFVQATPEACRLVDLLAENIKLREQLANSAQVVRGRSVLGPGRWQVFPRDIAAVEVTGTRGRVLFHDQIAIRLPEQEGR